MGDLIEILKLIQKLNYAGFVLDDQLDYITKELSSKLSSILTEESADFLNQILNSLRSDGTINLIN